MNRYRHRIDCCVVREHRDFPASAVLMDCDGDVLHRFDEEWTDDQIFAALDFANAVYNTGVQVGQHMKAREILLALGAAKNTSASDG